MKQLLLRWLALFAVLVLAACGGDDAPVDTTARTVSVSEVHPNIAKIYSDPFIGPRCSQPAVCNGVVRVECSIEVDGPETYFKESNGEVIMNCGGSCMLPNPADPKACKACPPKEWSCVK